MMPSKRNVWLSDWASEENARRDQRQSTSIILETLDAGAGMRVADVGAGAGYFAFKLAKIVGPGGLVTATDYDADMVAHIEQACREREIQNVRAVRVQTEDETLGLEADSADRILMVNVLDARGNRVLNAARRWFGMARLKDDPLEVILRGMKRALRHGGRVVVYQDSLESVRSEGGVPQVLCLAETHGLAVLSARWFRRPKKGLPHDLGYTFTLVHPDDRPEIV